MEKRARYVEDPPAGETAAAKYRRRQAWPSRKFPSLREANEHEINVLAAMTAGERVGVVMVLRNRRGDHGQGIRQAAAAGRLKVVRKNWRSSN